MDARPFRQFLELHKFASGSDLMHKLPECQATRNFIIFVMDLREDWRGRRSLGEVQQQFEREAMGFKPTQWYTVLQDEAYNLWLMLHRRWKPRTHRLCEEPAGLTQRDRRKFAKLGQCKPTAPHLKHQGQDKTLQLWENMERQPYCLWFDNFYRKRFIPTPASEDRSLNVTAMAVHRLPRVPPCIYPLYLPLLTF